MARSHRSPKRTTQAGSRCSTLNGLLHAGLSWDQPAHPSNGRSCATGCYRVFNFVDLAWHECEFREGDSFTYAVYVVGGRYLGCCYLYPMGRRTGLTEELVKHDVDVSWWVTPEAYEQGLLPEAVRRAAALGGGGVPVHHAALLEPRDP